MLSKKYINDKNITKAAREALNNAKILILGGHLHEAYAITQSFFSEGAWEINHFTEFASEVELVHILLCWWLSIDCPAIGSSPARNSAELTNLAEENWEKTLDNLLMSTISQKNAVGSDWSEDYFKQLERMEQTQGRFKEYGGFVSDLEQLLKDKLRNKLTRRAPDLIPSFLKALTPFRTDSKIKVSTNTSLYDSHFLLDKLEYCTDIFLREIKSSHIGIYEETIYQCQLIIDTLEKNHNAINTRVRCLLKAQDIYHSLLKFCYWSNFKELVEKGQFAELIGLSKAQIDDYFENFKQRSAPQNQISSLVDSSSKVKYMSLEEFISLAQSTPLANFEVIELPIPQTQHCALALRVNKDKAFAAWQVARSLVEQTHRWPVLTISRENFHRDWKKNIHKEDFFSRHVYENENFQGKRFGLSPEALIKGANELDLNNVLEELIKENHERDNLKEYIDDAAQQLDANNPELAKEQLIRNIDLTKPSAYRFLTQRFYLLHIEKNGLPPLELQHIDSYDDLYGNNSTYLHLLPTTKSWEVSAFINWYGAYSGSEIIIAQLKQWHEHYGAELVLQDACLLKLVVVRQPNLEEALDLAYIQDLLAPCTYGLSGTSLAEYAVALMHSYQWYLAEYIN